MPTSSLPIITLASWHSSCLLDDIITSPPSPTNCRVTSAFLQDRIQNEAQLTFLNPLQNHLTKPKPYLPWRLRWQRVCLQCTRLAFNPWVRKILWRRKWQPTPVLLPGRFHGWRSMVSYSPWDCKELDMTEWLHFIKPYLGFPSGSTGKEPTCQGRRHKRRGFNPWVRKIPWRRAWQPTPVVLPGESHGQRSLVGYSLWGRKESDMTEQLNWTELNWTSYMILWLTE